MKTFRTLRGFLEGGEPEEETYFAFSATLRISGDIPDLEEVSRWLGLKPTHIHRKGESRGEGRPPWPEDFWSYQAELAEAEPLERHIDRLWAALKPHKEYLHGLKKRAAVDVFLGYRSNCDHAGIEVPHTALVLFAELEIPFGLSIIIA
jgi:hypothetical protein